MRIKVRPDYLRRANDGRRHRGLAAGAEFFVIGVGEDSYRVVDLGHVHPSGRHLGGEPILYPKACFVVLDDSVPSGWSFHEAEDGEYFLGPRSTGIPGLYEDWHGSDGDAVLQASARQTLRDELERMATDASPADRALIDETLARLPPPTSPRSPPYASVKQRRP